MYRVQLATESDFDGWRTAARQLAGAQIPGSQILWSVGSAAPDLLGGNAMPPPADRSLSVPRDFVQFASRVILHRSPERFSLLYALLLRVIEQPLILRDRADRDVHKANRFAQAVRRDIHKMRAFVRFRELTEGMEQRFVAWFEPEHHILRANASFFVGRFANMRWSILTPLGSMHWDGETVTEGPPARRQDAPADDPVEAVWKTYYASIFNPSRLMTDAMIKEMPKKYWKNMPETALIPELIAGARRRELQMIDASRGAASENVKPT